MKIREIYREAVDTSKDLLKWGALAGAFLAVGYAREQFRENRNERLYRALIVIGASQNNGSESKTIEVRDVRYVDGKLEVQMTTEEERK